MSQPKVKKRYSLQNTILLLALILLLISCGTADVVQPTASTPNKSNGVNMTINTDGIDIGSHDDHDHHGLKTLMSRMNTSAVLQENTTALGSIPSSTGSITYSPPLQPLFAGSPRVEMKLLIISAAGNPTVADSSDPVLDGVRYFAQEIGIPYDVMIAKDETLTEAKLIAANGDGKYQGIIVTETGLLADDGTGQFLSTFTQEEWNLLWQYEREFDVRHLAMSGFPGAFPEDYGLRFVSSTGEQSTAKLTANGATIFNSLKSDINIPIKNAFTYRAKLCTGTGCPTVDTQPILTDQATGSILGAITNTADGREILSLTMNHNSFLEHTGLMAYDLLSWVTQGIFIGERRYYLSIDVDDWYLSSLVWNPATNSNFTFEEKTFRLSATDVYNTRDGILDLRSRFNVPNLNYNQVFNANGADPTARRKCTNNASLSEATLCVGDFFPWVNHTFTHADMDFLDYAGARKEFEDNIVFAEGRLPAFDRQFLVTGRHSGLGWRRITDANGASCVVDQVPGDPYCQFGLQSSNPAMLQAAVDLGINYLAANRGWITHEAACDTCLIVHPQESRIKLIPRWPTNVFFNVTDPTENASEFNYLYGPNGIVRDGNGNSFFATDQTWEQVLEFEADIAMRHILSGSPYPHFVHQGNLREYSPGKSLLYDWTEATLEVFDSYFNIPLISQDWAELTTTLEQRTSFFNANASGVWDRSTNAVSVSSSNGGIVFVTGATIAGASTFNYGNATVSIVNLGAGQTTGVLPPLETVTVAAIAAQSSEEGLDVSLQVNAQHSSGATLSYAAIGLPTGLTISSTTGIISGSPSIPGLYTVTATATDGVVSGAQSFEWTVIPDTTDVLGNNLLVNGDFESGIAPWVDGVCGTGTISSSTDAIQGVSAVSLSSNPTCIAQTIVAEPNTDYNLSCKTSNLGGTYADMSIYFGDASGTNTLGEFVSVPAVDYTEYTLSATSPENTTSAAVYIYLSGTGQILIDDCVLQATLPTPTTPPTEPPTVVDDLPWLESFSLANGATSDADTTAWTSTRTSGSFGIQDGRFAISEVGGEAVWQSEVINVATATNGIAFSSDVLSGGNVDAVDYLRMYYVLDSGAEVLFYDQSGKINKNKNFRTSSEIPAASTLQIIIRLSTDENRESYAVDNISLQAR